MLFRKVYHLNSRTYSFNGVGNCNLLMFGDNCLLSDLYMQFRAMLFKDRGSEPIDFSKVNNAVELVRVEPTVNCFTSSFKQVYKYSWSMAL